MLHHDRAVNVAAERGAGAAHALRRWRWACGAYLALLAAIVALAGQGASPVSFVWPYDAMMHFVLLGLAGWLLHRALDRQHWRRLLPVGPILVALAAAAEETSQLLVPARTFSVADLTANLAGVAVTYALDSLWLRRCRTAARPTSG